MNIWILDFGFRIVNYRRFCAPARYRNRAAQTENPQFKIQTLLYCLSGVRACPGAKASTGPVPSCGSGGGGARSGTGTPGSAGAAPVAITGAALIAFCTLGASWSMNEAPHSRPALSLAAT